MKIKASDYRKMFFCGDIHGNLKLLLKGLKKLGYDSKKDVIVTMGDVIDRGEHSLETAMFFLAPEKTENGFPSALSSRGNHEDFGIDAHVHQNKDWIDSWHYHGGSWTKEFDEDFLINLFSQINSDFPLYFDIEFNGKHIVASHASIPGYKYENIEGIRDKELVKICLIHKPEQLPVEDLLEEYEDEDFEDEDFFVPELQAVSGVDLAIHGHTHVNDPYMYKNRLYLDTGSLKNYLTLMTLSEEDGVSISGVKLDSTGDDVELVSVPSKIKENLEEILF